MTVYTVLPQDDLNLEVTVTDPALAPTLQDDSDLDVTIQESDNPVVLNITPAAVSVTSAVLSVNTKTGHVTLDTDDISEGSNNLYYTDARADARVDLQTGANLDLSFADTDDLAEGPNNLYYTDARAYGANSGGTGVTYNNTTGEISIGQDVATDSDVTFNTVTATDEFIGHLDGSVRFTAKNRSGSTIEPGQVVYISGLSGNTPEVELAKSNSASTMPAFGIAIQTIGNNNNGQFATFGSQRNLDISDWGESGITFSEGDILYVSATEAGRLTNVLPTGESNQIQNIGMLERATPSANTTIKVGGAGRSNDTPNLDDGNIFIGDSNNNAITNSLDTAVGALGYIKSETDNQTLSFSDPNLTISNGNTVDISGINNITSVNGATGVVVLDTDDVSEGTSNLYYTDAKVQTVIDNNTNGFITASSTETLTNKSGNISMFTNDAGYLTSETDSQTLSFSSPNLSISNGNSVDLSDLNVNGGTY